MAGRGGLRDGRADGAPGGLTPSTGVLRPGGTLLLLTDVNHDANVCEPQEFSWEIVGAFADELRVDEERHLERGAHGMLAALRSARPYDDSRPHLAGILSVRFTKLDLER
jgi:hypothetical protein